MSTIINKIKQYKQRHFLRNEYCTGEREKFYLLAGKYLPSHKESVVVDIGSGDGGFCDTLNLSSKFTGFVLVDSNDESILALKNKYGDKHALKHRIPNKMPFKDKQVDFIHCSHIVEHIEPSDLYKFLKDVDRVLSNNGVLVISAPLFWPRFYDDLSHVKPYNPSVFMKYLSVNYSNTRTSQAISRNYKLLDLVYRYRVEPMNNVKFYGNKFFILDFVLYSFKILFSKIGFRQYIKNGYVLVLQKDIKK